MVLSFDIIKTNAKFIKVSFNDGVSWKIYYTNALKKGFYCSHSINVNGVESARNSLDESIINDFLNNHPEAVDEGYKNKIFFDYHDYGERGLNNGVPIEDVKLPVNSIIIRGQFVNSGDLMVNQKVITATKEHTALMYMGTWKPSSNEYPRNYDSQGVFYVVDEAGTFDGVSYNKGNIIIYKGNGSWDKYQNSLATTINGLSGDVVINAENLMFTDDVSIKDAVSSNISETTKLNELLAALGISSVETFNSVVNALVDNRIASMPVRIPLLPNPPENPQPGDIWIEA